MAILLPSSPTDPGLKPFGLHHPSHRPSPVPSSCNLVPIRKAEHSQAIHGLAFQTPSSGRAASLSRCICSAFATPPCYFPSSGCLFLSLLSIRQLRRLTILPACSSMSLIKMLNKANPTVPPPRDAEQTPWQLLAL